MRVFLENRSVVGKHRKSLPCPVLDWGQRRRVSGQAVCGTDGASETLL